MIRDYGYGNLLTEVVVFFEKKICYNNRNRVWNMKDKQKKEECVYE